MIKIQTVTGEMILGKNYEITNAQKSTQDAQTPVVTRYWIGYYFTGNREGCCSTNQLEVTEESYNKLIKEIK